MADDRDVSGAVRYLVCNCERTMEIDGDAMGRDLGLDGDVTVHTSLCRQELERFGEAIGDDGSPLVVACTQEAPLFAELAAEGERPSPRFVNIRERAGWCADAKGVQPKMAALLADATHVSEPTGVMPVTSQGVCLVYGAGQETLDAAEKLAARLNVSVILTDASDVVPPSTVHVPIYRGTIKALRGSLGRFEVVVDHYAPMVPSSKNDLQFVMARDGASSTCDVVLDMSGGDALVTDPDRRDGYLRADPAKPGAVAEALFAASDLVGEFEKPLYVRYDGDICAHSRNQKVGCDKCLGVCPTGAITPAGDLVAVDAGVCGGCGSCASICPSGAMSYRYPQANDIVARVQGMVSVYRAAGGDRPVILLHGDQHGGALIAASARFGRGLPVHVLPVGLFSVTQIGHDSLLAMIAAGAAGIVVAADPKHAEERDALEQEIALTEALLAGVEGDATTRMTIVETNDPDVLEEALHTFDVTDRKPRRFSTVGTKRELARTAIGQLIDGVDHEVGIIALPSAAPYGRISIRSEGCTLCLACVSCCPANALADNPDQPQVAFTEAACVQCGLCANTCPESVITLEPRFNPHPDAMTPQVLHHEEPFSCVSCGKPFGVKSTVEAVVAKLQGNNPMFQTEDRVRLIKMCDDCRVQAMADDANPMAMGERQVVRTTEDYVKAEAEAKASGLKPEDFLN